MATRSRTKEFLRRRKGGRSKERPSNWGSSDDQQHQTLLGADTLELSPAGDSRLTLPPEWVDDVEEAQELMGQIRTKTADLKSLHNKHINQPDIDNLMEEEHRIEILTSEITSTFHRGQKAIQAIGRKARDGSSQGARVTKNVQQSLAAELQDMSQLFRKAQSSYLRRVRGREEQQKGFEIDVEESAGFEEDGLYEKGFSEEHQQQLRSNTNTVAQREKEITSIVNSITELSTIFKDLAILVVDQGSILDRIDYNLEQSSVHIESGREKLEQSEKYQKKASKKLYCIFLLILVVVIIFAMILAKGGNSPATTVAPNTTPPM